MGIIEYVSNIWLLSTKAWSDVIPYFCVLFQAWMNRRVRVDYYIIVLSEGISPDRQAFSEIESFVQDFQHVLLVSQSAPSSSASALNASPPDEDESSSSSSQKLLLYDLQFARENLDARRFALANIWKKDTGKFRIARQIPHNTLVQIGEIGEKCEF